jgi:hypothetical protein
MSAWVLVAAAILSTISGVTGAETSVSPLLSRGGAGGIDAATLRPGGAESDTLTYYAGEVVVLSDRPERFELFAPAHAGIRGSVTRALEWAPHVRVSDYGTSSYPSARGLPAEHVMVEYDGVPLNSIQNGLFDLALLDVLDVRGTVMRGPFARLGVGRPAQAAVSLSSGLAPRTAWNGVFGSDDEALTLVGGREGLAFELGFLDDEGCAEHTAVSGFGGVLRLTTPRLETGITLVTMDRELPGPGYDPGFAGTQVDQLSVARVGLPGLGRARASFYATHHRQRYESVSQSPHHVVSSAGGTAELDLAGLTVRGVTLTASYDYSVLESCDPKGSDLGRHERGGGTIVTGYVGRWRALGVAVEGAATHTTDFGVALSGAVGLAFVGRTGRAWVARGQTYRAPTMNELYWPADAWSAGNPDLDPSRVTTTEVGAAIVRGPVAGSVSAYHSEARDLITWVEDNWFWEPANVGRARLNGVELDLSASVGPAVLSYAGAFSRAKDALTGNDLPYRPEVEQQCALALAAPRSRAELRARWTGDVYTDADNTLVLDGYTVADALLSVRLPAPVLGLGLEIRNVFDERYETRSGYGLPGREWRVRITVGS